MGAKSIVLTTVGEETHEKIVIEPQIKKGDDFPEIQIDMIEALYAKFRSVILSSVDLNQYGNPEFASREIVKKVSDVIWNTLTRSYYKDRAHLQSLYSYLTGNYF